MVAILIFVVFQMIFNSCYSFIKQPFNDTMKSSRSFYISMWLGRQIPFLGFQEASVFSSFMCIYIYIYIFFFSFPFLRIQLVVFSLTLALQFNTLFCKYLFSFTAQVTPLNAANTVVKVGEMMALPPWSLRSIRGSTLSTNIAKTDVYFELAEVLTKYRC